MTSSEHAEKWLCLGRIQTYTVSVTHEKTLGLRVDVLRAPGETDHTKQLWKLKA